MKKVITLFIFSLLTTTRLSSKKSHKQYRVIKPIQGACKIGTPITIEDLKLQEKFGFILKCS